MALTATNSGKTLTVTDQPVSTFLKIKTAEVEATVWALSNASGGIVETATALNDPGKLITPGTVSYGSWATTTASVQGNATQTGYTCTAIARWDVVPNQDISGDANVGVVAFHLADIDHVSFAVDGGSFLSVSSMSLNAQTAGPMTTGVVEYWATIRASSLMAGPHEVRAVVYPNVGVPRVLTTTIYVPDSATGSQYSPVYASVSTTGNDSTGAVSEVWANATASRYASIGAAALAIKAYRNTTYALNYCDGGIIRLTPEVHAFDMADLGGIKTGTRWLTIEPEPGHSSSDTIIRNAAGMDGSFRFDYLRLRDVGVERTSGDPYLNSANEDQNVFLWMDACDIVGLGQYNAAVYSGPVNTGWTQVYYTGNEISQEGFGAVAAKSLVRANYIHHLGNDAMQNVDVAFYNRVDNIAAVEPAHADVWQRFGTPVNYDGRDDNLIFYGNVATEILDEGLFVNLGNNGVDSVSTRANGIAIVGNSIAIGVASNPALVTNGWYRFSDHLLWWSNTFDINTEIDAQGGNIDPVITNFSVKNNAFRRLDIMDDNVDFSHWESNTFEEGPTWPA
jgi:hypothetical protein